MRCLVTCGPTYESLDQVRRLTNFSTGRLGTELANFLTERGHEVTAFQGYYTTYRPACQARTVLEFTTTAHLLERFQEVAKSEEPVEAVFHAAAVSDFQFGKIYRRGMAGELQAITSGKYTTREGTLLAELIPTPKLIGQLRGLFPKARLIGWKYEVDGGRAEALALGARQIAENGTDYCVVNGAAYGEGFGVLEADGVCSDCGTPQALFGVLESILAKKD